MSYKESTILVRYARLHNVLSVRKIAYLYCSDKQKLQRPRKITRKKTEETERPLKNHSRTRHDWWSQKLAAGFNYNTLHKAIIQVSILLMILLLHTSSACMSSIVSKLQSWIRSSLCRLLSTRIATVGIVRENCGQTPKQMNTPLDMEVELGQDHHLLDGVVVLQTWIFCVESKVVNQNRS